jgi:hyperosmotically inducible periplasmic protein
MRFIITSCVAAALLFAAFAVEGEDGVGERIGRTVDQAVDQVRQGFEEARKAVDRLSIQGRVYARLHWDKTLNDAPVSVEVGNDGVATIRGTVPNEPAKAKAEQLTNETVGVQRVVNELQIMPPPGK